MGILLVNMIVAVRLIQFYRPIYGECAHIEHSLCNRIVIPLVFATKDLSNKFPIFEKKISYFVDPIR